MNEEKIFITAFTQEFSLMLNALELAEHYKESLDFKKTLIAATYTNKLKPLCEGYFKEVYLPEITISSKDYLDKSWTYSTLFGWQHFHLKGDLKKGTNTLLSTLIKAV